MPHAIASDGTRIHYETRGRQGPWAVLLQGLGLSSRFWFDLPERVAADPELPHRVLLVDNRGTGRSDRPRGPYRMARLADDVLAAMDAAGVASAIVVGISMGGMIAQHVALRGPERVQGLVLLATSAGVPHVRLPAPRTLRTFATLPTARPEVASKALVDLLVPPEEQHRTRELFRGWGRAAAEDPLDGRIFLAHLSAVLTHSTGFRLRRVECPAVVVTGAEDVLIPPRNSELLAELLPNARLEVLPAVGHGIPLLAPDVVNRAVRHLADRGRARPDVRW